ncbi:Bubble protein [Fusarium austroafricanum]|uniref:Bubble protein n=1 Tax=Fusarium austroafricanum TaxID=2364996 RepID=A0A8H4K4P2_9HYPO|nr:Bubble protein [Fusarium austroafricanum]
MKFSIILTAFWVAAVAASPADTELTRRNDCGKGGAPYTRRTNSPCGAGNGRHTYCGCDQTGIVRCIGGRWGEIRDCKASNNQKCYGIGSGAHCGVVLTPGGGGL